MIAGSLPRIGLRDSNFSPGDLDDDTYFTWDRECQGTDIVVFTDWHLPEVLQVPARVKCAWLVEPPVLHPEHYQAVLDNHHLYDYVFTFVYDFVRLGPKFLWYPFGGCWVPEPDFRVHEKSKNVSIIASAKDITEGHRLRHEVVRRFGDRLDGAFGGGYEPLPPKEGKVLGLGPYRYSIAIENSVQDAYFTEKVLDCFATGTVPIYWGTRALNEHFDERGIIYFSDLDELEGILDSIGPDDYESRRAAIERNLESARRFTSYNRNLWEWALGEVHAAAYGRQGE